MVPATGAGGPPGLRPGGSGYPLVYAGDVRRSCRPAAMAAHIVSRRGPWLTSNPPAVLERFPTARPSPAAPRGTGPPLAGSTVSKGAGAGRNRRARWPTA
ncbi:hypothetical protein JCM13210_08520 [Thermaerobacter litoralis]